MLDLRTWSALPHVGGVVPLFERLRCSLHGCELCHNRCHAGCTSSPLWQEQALSTCAAVEQPDSVPEPRHCRSLESWQVCAWCGGPSLDFLLSRRESAAPLPAPPPNQQTGSCEKAGDGKTGDSRKTNPDPRSVLAFCEPLMTQGFQWGSL